MTILLLLLTLGIGFAILKKRKKKIHLKRIVIRQSLMHEAIKDFLPPEAYKRNVPTQSKKRKEQNTIRIVKTPDNKVYWVKNNVFYWTEMVDGGFDPSDGIPIETEHLSKKEVDSLLYILDLLKNG